ncbi:cache domain-containing protein [Pseudanabaena galeata UHCC 0370]|uniref:histidine kinase n=1 Tax=Pseudanabaena galeata UHCC 0370 TaxID=3110310 RepID=A0ABU5TGK3_9CYAN|nr:cache domain-containing protein [Pseudanabaena galeata]MEA5477391.1 cache domain-containing protein [Pseudanabaena galeata UHCC 0370]
MGAFSRNNAMSDRQSSPNPSKSRKLPLKFILIGQFVILIVGISGLMAWLSWQSEQKMIANLVGKLQNEVSDRIKQKLSSYLETPHLINKINADAVRQGTLKTQGKASEIYLWQQIQNFPTVSWIYYGGEKAGGFVGITRLDKQQNPTQSFQLAINVGGFRRYYYNLDAQGNRRELRGKSEFYDARQRPWYQAALQTDQPIWSPIYQDSTLPEQVITASLPVYNADGKRIGVLGADLSLGDISQFLDGLQIGKSGEAFILEPSGLLVASSNGEKPYEPSSDPQKLQRLPVKNIKQPMIRDAVGYLEKQIGSLDNISTEQNFKFSTEGKNIFFKVLPYRDERGINWLIAVVMPESDFMEQIDIKRQNTILLVCLSLAGAIALGVLTTQYINKSLRRLTLASQALANGELDREVPSAAITELNILSQSFNQMATQLKQSFAEFGKINENLELRIQDRVKELQESENKFRNLVSNFSGLVYRCNCDRDWSMEFIGGAVTELTGYLAEEFIANQVRSWTSIIHPEDRETVKRVINESLTCHEPFILEYRIIDSQGTIRWLYEKGQGIFTEEDQLLWIDGAIFDISDRKQVESELLERVHLSILMAEVGSASTQLNTLEEVLQAFVESLWRHMNISFVQIWTINAFGDDLNLQVSTGNYNKSDSDRLSNLIKRERIWSVTQGRFQPLLTDQIVADLSESDRLWLQEQGIVSLVGHPLIVKGKVIGVILMISQFHLDMDVQNIDLIANAIAIGIDHKQSEERLRVTNAEMKALFAAMDEVILVRDRMGRVLKIPQTRRQSVFLDDSKVIGRLPSELFSPEQASLFSGYIQHVLETQQALNVEYLLSLTDQPIWWNASISPIDTETVVWVARDITESKKVEQQLNQAKQAAEAASKAKGQFLASMSHELRTPLNAILGFAQLMVRDTSLKDNHRSYLKIIHDSGEHLLELINDVLDMSKIESGRITLNITSFDLYHLLDTLEKMFRLKVNDKSLQLLFRRSSQVPQWINTDEGKLRQILINLLSNAIKFTNQGSIILSIDIESNSKLESLIQEKTPTILKFTVEDTGEGIPANYLGKIFEAFEQTELGKRTAEGTGLGLPISLKFAQFMGGEITVSSQLGEGSIFRVYLPVNVSASPLPLRQTSDRYIIGLAPHQPEYRLLVVEDRWESRHLLVKILEAVGFKVREAENGAEAIAIWEEWQPHLIWMDMRMPVMDGYEATRQIKTYLKGQATVIIALTASALEEEKAIILSAGCDDFVRKPFREALIFDKLAEYLGVTYLYEDESNRQITDRDTDDLETLAANLKIYLSQMPDSWIRQLHQAATLADNDLISELLKSIPESNTVLIHSLISLVDNFCYNQIMDSSLQAFNK